MFDYVFSIVGGKRRREMDNSRASPQYLHTVCTAVWVHIMVSPTIPMREPVDSTVAPFLLVHLASFHWKPGCVRGNSRAHYNGPTKATPRPEYEIYFQSLQARLTQKNSGFKSTAKSEFCSRDKLKSGRTRGQIKASLRSMPYLLGSREGEWVHLSLDMTTYYFVRKSKLCSSLLKASCVIVLTQEPYIHDKCSAKFGLESLASEMEKFHVELRS